MGNRSVTIILVLIMVDLILIIGLFLCLISGIGTTNYGVACVQAMYSFDTPSVLVSNQKVVKKLLCDEDWERLNLDNPLRAVNAYYKFGYSSSEVDILWHTGDCVCYQLDNENIQPETYWLFQYDMSDSGKMCDIKEYKVVMLKGSEELVELRNSN